MGSGKWQGGVREGAARQGTATERLGEKKGEDEGGQLSLVVPHNVEGSKAHHHWVTDIRRSEAGPRLCWVHAAGVGTDERDD